jgi:N-acetyl-gamma-glutamyl-phosphate reductase|tara:strand:+ start:1573 stop:2604 length:1032 start_codon:yes stop_codon:yes gene_type:complete
MKVGIIGASGYTGGELLRLLGNHTKCEITCATSRKEKGKKISEIHPHLRGINQLRFVDLESLDISSDTDFVFTATPHSTAMEIVPELLDQGIKIIDLSGDFRFEDVNAYEQYYGVKHKHPEIKAVFGLPELYRKEISNAKFVANPGCYPTTVIIGLAPLLKEGIIEHNRIVADSKSGISGAGKGLSYDTQFCMAEESITPYKLVGHRHLPEIEQELKKFNRNVKISFVPHLVPVIRGLSTTLHCFLKRSLDETRIHNIFTKFFKGEPFVRILDVGEIPRMSAVRGTNYIHLGGFQIDSERERIVIVSTIDNLVKGASGQAIQNMNLMQGYKETCGLEQIGIHP